MIKKREKIYYPSAQIITGLYTSGSEFETEEGKEYVGNYHTYINGAIYSEFNYIKGKSIVLKPIERSFLENKVYGKLTNDSFKLKDTSINSISTDYYNPTEEEIEDGFYVRYFIRKKNVPEFKEIDRPTYDSLKDDEMFLKFYFIFEMNWYFKEPMYDYIKDDMIIVKGYMDENKRNSMSIDKKYFGFIKYMNIA